MNFKQFISDIEDKKWKVHGVEAYKDGELVHSYGDTEDGVYDIYSATKSIFSIAVGIVYDRGLIDFDAPILQYLPKDTVDSLDEVQKNTFERISVKRLLTMSVEGFPFRPEGENYLKFALGAKIDNPDEKVFSYSNVPVYLVCVALQTILGEDLGTFIESNVLQPLGIDKYEYGRSPEGIFYGASKMKLTVNGLSRIGLLMMNKGVYDGRRIISEEYVKMATSVQQMSREGGYGLYFWKYRDGFSINGKWKQKCYCLPEENIMVTYLAHIEDSSSELRCSMERNILGITPKKIVILGCSGSGKSTFSRELRDVTGLPVIHLDNVWWNADRTHITRDEFDARLAEIMREEQWIIDGDYSRTYEERIKACDTVIFLDYTEEECMNGIIGRVGQDRDDMPWTENTLDPELVKMVKEYATYNRPQLYDLFYKYYFKEIIVFKSRVEASEWLEKQKVNRVEL